MLVSSDLIHSQTFFPVLIKMIYSLYTLEETSGGKFSYGPFIQPVTK